MPAYKTLPEVTPFYPTTPGDWSVVPATVQQALDDLAGTPSSGGGLSTPYACPIGVAVGEAVYLSGADAVDQAKADSVSTMPAIGLVASKPSAVRCIVRYNEEMGGLAGLSPTATYYVSETTAGAITATAPSAIGQVIQRVGVARSATRIVVLIDRDFDVL